MGIDATDVQSFVIRSHTLFESAPPETTGETRTWLVEPFLELLGWSPAHTERNQEIDGFHLEYVCTIEDIPALFVAVDPASQSLREARERALQSILGTHGVDRALYTNGQQFTIITDENRRSRSLKGLPENLEFLETLSFQTLTEAVTTNPTRRVASQLAANREELTAAITATLTDVAGEQLTPQFETAAENFLKSVIDALEDDSALSTKPARQPKSSVEAEPTEAATLESESEAESEQSSVLSTNESEPETEPHSTSTSSQPSPPEPTMAPNSDSEGEYVVRFFAEHGSVGAIGHSTPEGALVEVAEYLFERGLSGIRTPWGPEDGAEIVLNDEPMLADGSPMTVGTQLSNGYYLNADGDTGWCATVITAMATRAGFRAMLTGDWESSV